MSSKPKRPRGSLPPTQPRGAWACIVCRVVIHRAESYAVRRITMPRGRLCAKCGHPYGLLPWGAFLAVERGA